MVLRTSALSAKPGMKSRFLSCQCAHLGCGGRRVDGSHHPSPMGRGRPSSLTPRGRNHFARSLEALPPVPAAAKTVARERAYFTYHADRLDYPRYHALGFPIGSGIIESDCKTVLKQRECGSGMRWRERGAQAVATLRAIARSRRWEALWQEHPWSRLVPTRRRIAA